MHSLTWYCIVSGARLFNFQSNLLYACFQRCPWISLARICLVSKFSKLSTCSSCFTDISQLFWPIWYWICRIPLQKSLEIPWKSLDFSWKISKKSKKFKDFYKLGKGAKIQGFLGHVPRNPRKLGFHESVILFNNIQGFPWKAWKLMILAFHVFQAFLGNCVPSFQAFPGNPWILLNKITLSWNPSFLGFLGKNPRNLWIFAPFPSFWKSLDFLDSLEIFQEKSKDFQGISKLFL